MSYKVVAYIMGKLLAALTITLAVPFLAAVYWQEASSIDFIGTIIFSFAIAIFLYNYGELEHDNLTVREGMAITGLSWLLVSLIGTIPFIAGHHLGVIDAVFESISGFTCTGASVIPDLDAMPRSIILWRSIMHWLGGLGIIVIFIAIFPQPGNSVMKIFDTETTGPSKDRMVPRIKNAAHALLFIYIGFTYLMLCLLLLCGYSLFDAINIAFSTLATGGFGVLNDSIAGYNNFPAEMVIIFFMLVGGGNFGLYFMAWRKGISKMLHNIEFRIYLIMFVVFTCLITINLTSVMGMHSDFALKNAAFQVASTLTTTGLGIDNYNTWPAFSQYCIVVLMLTGGCAGSTSGGMKIARVVILCKMVGKIIKEKLHPNSFAIVRMEEKQQDDVVIFKTARFFFLYIFLALMTTIFFNFDGVPSVDSVMLALSCMGNVGVSFGLEYSFAQLPYMSKAVCSITMLVGRLEIFTYLAMLQASFWRENNW